MKSIAKFGTPAAVLDKVGKSYRSRYSLSRREILAQLGTLAASCLWSGCGGGSSSNSPTPPPVHLPEQPIPLDRSLRQPLRSLTLKPERFPHRLLV